MKLSDTIIIIDEKMKIIKGKCKAGDIKREINLDNYEVGKWE